MRKFILSAAAAASLLALPAFAANQLSSDPEIRAQQEWQLVVAKTQSVSPVTIATEAQATSVSNGPSSDAEIRAQQEWQQLVAQANANHVQALGDVASR